MFQKTVEVNGMLDDIKDRRSFSDLCPWSFLFAFANCGFSSKVRPGVKVVLSLRGILAKAIHKNVFAVPLPTHYHTQTLFGHI